MAEQVPSPLNHIPNADNIDGRGNLTVTRDFLERMKDAIKTREKDEATIAAQGETIATMRTQVERLIKYTEDLEKRVNPGNRVFQAPTRQGTEDRYLAGKAWTCARRHHRDKATEYDGLEIRAATQTEGGATAGSTLVPTITQPAVHRVVGEGSLARKLSMMIPIVGTNKMILPVNPNGPSISYADGNYPAEGNAPSAETGVSFTSKQMDVKTLLVLDTVSLELSEDALIAIEPLLAQIFGEAISFEENRQLLNSVNPFTGVCNTSGIGYYYMGGAYNAGKSKFWQLQHPDLVGAQFAINSKLIQRGQWAASPSFFANTVALQDSQKRPIYATGWTGGNMPGFQTDGSNPDLQAMAPAVLLGRPCWLSEAMNGVDGFGKVCAVYGDFRYHAFGLRKDLEIQWNDSVYFTQGVSAVRLRQRYAMVVIIPGAFAVLRTSDS